MKRIILISGAVILVLAAAAAAIPFAPVTVNVSFDRKTALVGQVIKYKIDISKAKGIEVGPLDIENARRFQETGFFRDRDTYISDLVSYEPGELPVPSVRVRYRAAGIAGAADPAWKEIDAPSSGIKINSLLASEPRMKKKVKTGGGLAGGPKSVAAGDKSTDRDEPSGPRKLSDYAIKDLAGPKEPVTAKDMALKALAWIAAVGGTLLAILVALAFYLTRPKIATPPDVEARQALLGLAADVEGRGIEAKEFYSRIVRIISAYLIGAFSLKKAEMTKTEILASCGSIPGMAGKPREILEGILSAAESTRYFDAGADKEDMVRRIEDVRTIIGLTKKHDV